jgi:imidazolonepropionase-like amidohydrolase
MAHDPFKNASGFVDAHVHIRDLSGLAVIAEAGVIAVRDAGTKDGTALGSAGPDGPRVISAGWALFKHGGYGARFGMPAGSRDEVKTEIHRFRSAGAGIIKVMASGIVSLKEPGGITQGGFDRDELAFIVDEAGRNGLRVMAHANGEAAIKNAASAGVRSIEHGFFMSERALMIMKDHDVFWVPTVGALWRAAGQHDVTHEVKKFIEDTIDRHLTMVRKAFEQGVSLAIGTDCVLPDRHYRAAYEAELAYFRRAGIPADDVLAIACDGGAMLLGIKA